MYIVSLFSQYDYEIDETIGVFDSEEKARKMMCDLEPRLDEEFKLGYMYMELNKVVDDKHIYHFFNEEEQEKYRRGV